MSALREILALFSIKVDDSDLKKGEASVDGFLGKIKDAGSAIAIAFGVTKIKGFIDGQLQAAGALRRSSATLGIATQQLQAYELAAQLAGVEGDAMTTGLRFLNRNLAQATSGSAEAAKEFSSVGISFKDSTGHARAAGDVIEELADKVAGLSNPAERTALAMRLLGRGGAQLIPLLSKGSGAFREATAEVKKLGGGLDDAFLAKAKEASHAQHELDFALVGLKTEIAGELLPAFKEIVTTVTGWVVRIREATRGTNTFRNVLEAFAIVAGAKTLGILVSLTQSLVAVGVAGARAAAAFIADWGAALLPVTAILAAVDILYYALTGKSLHGVIWDWLFGATDPSAIGGITDSLQGLKGGLLPGSPGAGRGNDATRALGGAIDLNTRALGVASGALGDTSDALSDTVDALKDVGTKLLGLGGTPVVGDRGAGARIEGIHLLRNDPFSAGPQGHAIDAYSQALHQKALYNPGGGVATSRTGDVTPHITQHIQTHIKQDIHTGASAAAIGVATGQGVATGVQRANDKARTSLRKP